METIDQKLRKQLSKQLRNLFKRSALRRTAVRLSDACTECGTSLQLRERKVDHIAPVVPVEVLPPGADNILEYFKRLFCLSPNGKVSLSNLQVLCEACHNKKSKAEMGLRAKNGTGPYSKEAKEKARATKAKRRNRVGKRPSSRSAVRTPKKRAR